MRSEKQIARAQAAVEAAGLPYKVLDENVDTSTGHVSICTMHLTKGLEFRCVAIMACEMKVIPDPERTDTVGEIGDLSDAFETERRLLYVAFTRARDALIVSYSGIASEFLEDLLM